LRKPHDAFGDQFRMLDQVGGMACVSLFLEKFIQSLRQRRHCFGNRGP
jgi:hypothetical protein